MDENPTLWACEGWDPIFTLFVFLVLVLVCDKPSTHAFQNEGKVILQPLNKQRYLKYGPS